jgi:peptide/nickel transport system permease protein
MDRAFTSSVHAESADVSEVAVEERFFVATQWQLMWWRFRKHHVAMIAAIVVVCFYMVVIGADFLAYADPTASAAQRSYIPPQMIQLFDHDRLQPFVYAIEGQRDPQTFLMRYQPDPNHKHVLRLFSPGFAYKLFGIIPTDIHLIGLDDGPATGSLSLLGSDQQGRDLWSRLVLATRTSLSIGLLGVGISLLLGVILGAISGYYGGVWDTIIQRIVEIARSIPTIPLWLGVAALLPQDWTITQIYFAITVIISLLGWTGLARVVRGRFLSLREEEFVMAAELAGCGQMRIIFRHMVPSFASHIIAAATLALPLMVISETALSFLGLGLRAPAISWGVLLQDAQNIQTVATAPWLMIPAIPVVVVVLAFNFLGDGLRDAADPYGV